MQTDLKSLDKRYYALSQTKEMFANACSDKYYTEVNSRSINLARVKSVGGPPSGPENQHDRAQP